MSTTHGSMLRVLLVTLLLIPQLATGPRATAEPVESDSRCNQILIWDYRPTETVLIYEVDRRCHPPARGAKIHIRGWLERCDAVGTNCTISEKKRTCKSPLCRVWWRLEHPSQEVARYRSEIEHEATKPTETGRGSVDWICYTTPADRDCIG